MNSPILQLLVLAGIAIFLILRLRAVLGSREGFEKPPAAEEPVRSRPVERRFDVIEGGPDPDIAEHVPAGSPAAEALARMKAAEPEFSVGHFLRGARKAYEMILMSFERGDLDEIRPFLSDEVFEAFAEVVADRKARGLTVEAEFGGLREMRITDARFDEATRQGEISVLFVSELCSLVRDSNGQLVEGSPGQMRRQRDVWTFARAMGVDDPNWKLVATAE